MHEVRVDTRCAGGAVAGGRSNTARKQRRDARSRCNRPRLASNLAVWARSRRKRLVVSRWGPNRRWGRDGAGRSRPWVRQFVVVVSGDLGQPVMYPKHWNCPSRSIV